MANPALGERSTPPRDQLAPDRVPADVAYQLIHDELLLDGRARLNLTTFLNLATFVTTWMEPEARRSAPYPFRAIAPRPFPARS